MPSQVLVRRPTKSLNLVKKLGIATTILGFLLFVEGWEIGKGKIFRNFGFRVVPGVGPK